MKCLKMGNRAMNAIFSVYCCKYVGLPELTVTICSGSCLLAFLLGGWIVHY